MSYNRIQNTTNSTARILRDKQGTSNVQNERSIANPKTGGVNGARSRVASGKENSLLKLELRSPKKQVEAQNKLEEINLEDANIIKELRSQVMVLKEICDDLDEENEELVRDYNSKMKEFEDFQDKSEFEYNNCRECYDDMKLIVGELENSIRGKDNFYLEKIVKIREELREAKSLGTRYINFIEVGRPLFELVGGAVAVYEIYNNPERVKGWVDLFCRHVGIEIGFGEVDQLLMGCGVEVMAVIAGYIGHAALSSIGPRTAILASKLSKVIIEGMVWVRRSLVSGMLRYYNASLMFGVVGLLAYYNQFLNSILAPYYADFKLGVSVYGHFALDCLVDEAEGIALRMFEYCYGRNGTV